LSTTRACKVQQQNARAMWLGPQANDAEMFDDRLAALLQQEEPNKSNVIEIPYF